MKGMKNRIFSIRISESDWQKLVIICNHRKYYRKTPMSWIFEEMIFDFLNTDKNRKIIDMEKGGNTGC